MADVKSRGMKFDSLNTGFTLVEVLAVLALTGIIALAWSSLYWTGYKGFDSVDSRTEVQDQARVAVDYIYRNLIQARKVAKLTSEEVVFITGSGQKLGLRYYNGTVYRDFYQTASSKYPSASNPVAERVRQLTFTSPQAGVIRVEVETSHNGYSYRIETSVSPRSFPGVYSK